MQEKKMQKMQSKEFLQFQSSSIVASREQQEALADLELMEH